MSYKRENPIEKQYHAFIRRVIIGLAALATCGALYFRISSRDAAKRNKSIAYYEQRIDEIETKIIGATYDIQLADTVIEKTAAKRKLDELERERRQLRDIIHRIRFND